jgi:glutamine cyclotransferase
MEKKKFVIEKVLTFFEVNVVLAESEDQALAIANESDYNASKYLGSSTVSVRETNKTFDELSEQYKDIDSFFFKGAASVNDDGYLLYYKEDGTVNGNMTSTKIF